MSTLNTVVYSLQGVDITYGNIVQALVVVIFAIFIKYLVHFVVHRTLKSTRAVFHSGMASFIQIASYLIYFIAALIILKTFGINITVLLAGSTALLVGVGLGMQQLFQNLVSGVTILFDGTVRVGDIIEYQGQNAKAVKIGTRTSTFETKEGISIIIPNSILVSESVYNVSYNKRPSLFFIEVGVDYSSKPEEIDEILIKCVKEHEKVLKTPEPFVRFTDYGDSALIFQVFFSTMQFFEIENIKSDIRYRVFEEFANSDIRIPFPQRVMHMTTE